MNIFKHKFICLIAGLAAGLSPLYAQSISEFKYTDPLPQSCAGFASVKLNNGNTMVLGGYSYFLSLVPITSNLIRTYDCQQEKWSVSRVRINTPRMYFDAVALPDGKVILAGGIDQNNNALDSVELYDPELESSGREYVKNFSIGKMSCRRRNIDLTLLDNGKVLITGFDKTADIIEKDQDGQFTIRPAKNKMNYIRNEHAAVKLNDGRVCLIAGRKNSIEIFDPADESFTLMKAKFNTIYDDIAAARLYNGKILLVGGQNIYSGKCVRNTWIYDPIKDVLLGGPQLMPTSQEKICVGISDLQITDLMPENKNEAEKVFFLCGGEDDNGKNLDTILDSAWIYLASSNEFIEVGPMNEPHDDFKIQTLPAVNNRLRALIISGHSTNDRITGHCEIFSCPAEIAQ